MIKTATSKILDLGNKLALAVFSASVALVLVASQWEYAAKSPLANYNVWFMLLGLLLGVLVVGITQKLSTKEDAEKSRYEQKMFTIVIMVSTLLFCILRWHITEQTWFITGWDPGSAVYTAFYEVDEWGMYSVYPNNLFIVGIFKAITALSRLYDSSFDAAYLLIIQIGGIAVCISCALVASASKNISAKVNVGYAVFALETLFIVLSPQSIIPYTDSYGMVAPAVCLYIFSLRIPGAIKLPCIISIAILGSAIKPNAIIVCIAIIMVAVLQMGINTITMRDKKKIVKSFFMFLGLLCVGVFCTNVIKDRVNTYASESEEITIVSEYAMSMAHFLMMGWNEETWGGYCQSDNDFSVSIPSYDERVQKNIDIFTQRIRAIPQNINNSQHRRTSFYNQKG